MEFKALSEEDQADMKELHAEWFPIDYPQEFFDRMHKTNVISLGCFYNVEVAEATDNSPAMVEAVLIGIIYSKVKTECEQNEQVVVAVDGTRWSHQSWL